MAKILIVEDEVEMANSLKDNFEFEGHEVSIAFDGDEGIKSVYSFSPDLIILDIMLPNKSGYDVCRELRSNEISIPIIFLSARGQEIDKVLGLELGADDYITKPFSVRELIARINAVLRRYAAKPKTNKTNYKIGKLLANFEKLTAADENGKVDLTFKEFEVLEYFVKNEGRIISRSELLDHVWGYDNFPTTRTVDNHIAKLRKKIETDPMEPKHIFTVYGLGYKFVE
ncbi:response regulator transcription factor [candidate division KSB1 bacterium]|nr:response regulator transcription factor [candidate division KSB1 bacterium]MBL7092724.1 response regulator transcription factor [candidate division KSB1 bacterium]